MSLLQTTYDVRVKIADYLTNRGIKRTFIAENIGKSKTHVSEILKGKREITDEVLTAINELLGTKFTKEAPGPEQSTMRATG